VGKDVRKRSREGDKGRGKSEGKLEGRGGRKQGWGARGRRNKRK